MSVTGVCQICEAAEATHACDQCGTLVCERHYDREHGVCVRCAASLGGEDDVGPGTGMR
ncbi:hypothetical protein [Halegenticoccus soli]|uniref:hypothetical protein n=1 Tax=Halegenticoccus soli TaxID=1985678 RepID=UPI0018EA8EDB|nr:hypothetical protein [Halegenticoccus soli]